MPVVVLMKETSHKVPADALIDDWGTARGLKFDLIVSVLVLQHIEPAPCRTYLEDFARMAPVVYLLSRADSDIDTNVFAAVPATNMFDAGECVEVDHDPDTHQLRVLGRKSLADASAPGAQGHFEVLLRSRI